MTARTGPECLDMKTVRSKDITDIFANFDGDSSKDDNWGITIATDKCEYWISGDDIIGMIEKDRDLAISNKERYSMQPSVTLLPRPVLHQEKAPAKRRK